MINNASEQQRLRVTTNMSNNDYYGGFPTKVYSFLMISMVVILMLSLLGCGKNGQVMDGDTVIVRRQDDAESDEIIIALVNGHDGVCKKLKKLNSGLMLISLNPQYDPMVFDHSEIDTMPVRILGRVVEVRRKM